MWLAPLRHRVDPPSEPRDGVPGGARIARLGLSKTTRKTYNARFKMAVAIDVVRGGKRSAGSPRSTARARPWPRGGATSCPAAPTTCSARPGRTARGRGRRGGAGEVRRDAAREAAAREGRLRGPRRAVRDEQRQGVGLRLGGLRLDARLRARGAEHGRQGQVHGQRLSRDSEEASPACLKLSATSIPHTAATSSVTRLSFIALTVSTPTTPRLAGHHTLRVAGTGRPP